ncbi:MAG: hypothetical protein L6Q59_01050 [Ignavibacteriaceae bacterium]|nr:hypothetical protein [Ignavibacteriaceae bacterium]
MKKVKLISLILFSLFFIISVNAQEFICPEVGPVIENRIDYRGYDMYKPAEGTLKVAVILAKTKNDMYDANNVNWPVS